MTGTKVNLLEAVGKCGDGDLLRRLAETALAQLMAFEVERLIGAAHGEPSAERTTHRNGYRERALHTRLGTLERADPQAQAGQPLPLVSRAALTLETMAEVSPATEPAPPALPR